MDMNMFGKATTTIAFILALFLLKSAYGKKVPRFRVLRSVFYLLEQITKYWRRLPWIGSFDLSPCLIPSFVGTVILTILDLALIKLTTVLVTTKMSLHSLLMIRDYCFAIYGAMLMALFIYVCYLIYVLLKLKHNDNTEQIPNKQ
jgi:hypothetical protein